MKEHKEPWSPLSVEAIAKLFSGALFPTWIAGGIALELALGRSIRDDHADIDVFMFHHDHLALRELLADWDCWVAESPGSLSQWRLGQTLAASTHNVWCRQFPGGDWQMQLMLDQHDGDGNWISRRDTSISASIQQITGTTESGINYLAPHIQLFYKAKQCREKDQIDFDAIVDSAVQLDKRWLADAIERCYGANHPWLIRLVEPAAHNDYQPL